MLEEIAWEREVWRSLELAEERWELSAILFFEDCRWRAGGRSRRDIDRRMCQRRLGVTLTDVAMVRSFAVDEQSFLAENQQRRMDLGCDDQKLLWMALEELEAVVQAEAVAKGWCGESVFGAGGTAEAGRLSWVLLTIRSRPCHRRGGQRQRETEPRHRTAKPTGEVRKTTKATDYRLQTQWDDDRPWTAYITKPIRQPVQPPGDRSRERLRVTGKIPKGQELRNEEKELKRFKHQSQKLDMTQAKSKSKKHPQRRK
ncbi:hypothetical protein PPACK8108_LOCUS23164 [Phakopsora pachyrhizi]|uniref:Uncharacterized protein n=1 Tax=Phakopsora pachyrhizi TaxID=170000 RepID=A0AAV0BPD8_PHAPC|nr:hypothetical protein PPACK8108_LOCUS23164 [Phakopsora pachyrhizi]